MIAAVRKQEGAGPPLVYLPGIDGSGDLLLGTAARLAERFTLLRLCYRPSGEDSYAALARSIDALLEERGAGRVLLLAESFGVAVALQLALDFPDRVAALALVNGFAHHPWRLRLLCSQVGAPLLQGAFFRVCRRIVSPAALLGPRDVPEVRARFLASGGVALDPAYRRRLSMIRGLDLRPRLGELRAPLALFASDQDRIVPALRAAQEIAARVPHATLEVLGRAGHLVLPLPEEPWLARLQELALRSAPGG